MDLSFGGIWSRDWNWNDDTGLEYYDDMENFWVIGQTGGNEKHVDEGAFAGQLLPGTKVRWREDPEKTIYTISSGVAEKQRIRYFSYSGNQSPIGYNSNNPPPWGLINLGSWTGILDSPDGWPQGGYHQNIGFTNPANFTKTWDLKFEPSLHWNPVESGIITNGHHITLQTRSGTASDISNFATGGTANPNNAYFKFDSVVGPCSVTGTDQQIAPGMMITSYNNTPVTWPTVEPNVSAANSIAFAGGGPIVKKIEYQQASGVYHVWLTGYKKILEASDLTFSTAIQNAQNIVFRQPGMNTYNETFIENYHWMDPNLSADDRRVESVGYTLEIIEAVNPLEVLPDDPAIWETEPKETTDLNIYYEASSAIPLLLNRETIATAIPIGSKILGSGSGYVGLLWLSTDGSTVNITSATDLTLDPTEIVVNNASEIFNIGAVGAASSDPLDVNDWLALNPQQVKITTPSGLEFITNIIACDVDDITITIDDTMPFYSNDFSLTWHNCFSFGNGVESNRIRDNFNLPYILNGVKASTTFAEQYKEEHRKYGLIYSGIYNSTSGVNNLNQFIQAERITKDINPVYGSIQKLHTRDTDLVTLCEDKVLKILANKDALFNADGNTQLTATANVLGQTIPFVGEYGISKNPESFASEAYRAYFTDKVRGAVMRLSMDGLTPISSHGMKNWFKDNLRLGDKIIGSYDDKKGEYNITIN